MIRDNTALIIGASSGIGEALALRLADEGYTVALVARREAELTAVAERINTRTGERRATAYPHDVTNYDEVPALFERIVTELGGIGAVIYAAGTMPQVGRDEYNFAKDRAMVETNFLGMVAWLNEAADLFGRLQGGVIVGIGSVAGDRGRSGQPVYHASKGAQAIYLESLRNRLDQFGVRVITVKPGPVDTPMTRHLGRQPFMITAAEAAREIALALPRGRSTIYVPRRWRLIMAVIRAVPSFIFRRIGMP